MSQYSYVGKQRIGMLRKEPMTHTVGGVCVCDSSGRKQTVIELYREIIAGLCDVDADV